MIEQIGTSGRDETLAWGFYSSHAEVAFLQLPLMTTHFEYTIQPVSLLDRVKAKFGESLSCDLSPGHLALIESGELQATEDLELIERMCDIQRKALIE